MIMKIGKRSTTAVGQLTLLRKGGGSGEVVVKYLFAKMIAASPKRTKT